jgi:hypothetical protein
LKTDPFATAMPVFPRQILCIKEKNHIMMNAYLKQRKMVVSNFGSSTGYGRISRTVTTDNFCVRFFRLQGASAALAKRNLLFFVSTELGKFQQAFPEFSKAAVEEVISIFKLYVISFLGNLPASSDLTPSPRASLPTGSDHARGTTLRETL